MKQTQSTSKYHSLDPREQYERSIKASENPHSIIVDEIGTPNYLQNLQGSLRNKKSSIFGSSVANNNH
jgi:hypothetical protein